MPWRHETPPFSHARFAGMAMEWRRDTGFFSAVLTFFYGVSFLLDPLVRTVPSTSVFYRWGEVGVVVIGAVFVAVAVWDALVSTREGYVMTVVVFSGFGVLSALRPLNITGLIFYVLVLVATFYHPQVTTKKEALHATPRH